MKNPEEHKKLLAQIAELEKNSVNYFDVEKEFFLIDSDNLAEVTTKLYGYTIQATGIYENDDLTEDAAKNLDGRGCYVYVEARDGKITIKQDLNGCWGIYLFRHGDYFALSNSFFRLLDHIKFKYPLTVNRDYCHFLMVNDICSHAYWQTAAEEVELIDRCTIVHIDVANKDLKIEKIDYKEHTVPLDSKEAMSILDNWFESWSEILHNVARNTQFFQVDLSGGFDSRIALCLVLHSGIDLSKVKFFSIKGSVHTYQDDYDIACQIANHYDFKLNQPFSKQQTLTYSFEDFWNLNAYARQTFLKTFPQWVNTKNIDRTYFVNGYGGELIRQYWQSDPGKRIPSQRARTREYSPALAEELFNSMKTILESIFSAIREKYNIADDNSKDIPQYWYQETRYRSLIGKLMLSKYFYGQIAISPILDPSLQTVRLNTPDCPDYNLLMTLLFIRYAPELLDFPFDSKHSINPETIEYARKINERFPICHKKVDNLNGGGQNFHLQPRDLQAEKILAEGKNNSIIPGQLLQSSLKMAFYSSKTFGLFRSCFDEELYNYAANNIETSQNTAYAYSVLGVVKVLQDVEISNGNRPLYRDMQNLLEQDFCRMHNDSLIIDRFKRYFTAVVIIIMKKNKNVENFQILSVSDDNAKISQPDWWQQFGVCHVIESYAGQLKLVAKTVVDGDVHIMLSAPLVRDKQDSSKRIPYWIDYTSFVVNGKEHLNTSASVWHNKPYEYVINAKAGDEIKIQVEWLPHRSDT